MTPRPEARRSARTGAWIALLVLLLGLALREAREDFPYQYAFDLYHPWAISLAREAPEGPRNPYTQAAAYGAFAGAAAERSSSGALRAAGRFWQGRDEAARFEPTGTPLYYATLALLPREYDAAHGVMALAQFAALAAAILVLGRLRGWTWIACGCAAALGWMAFNPFTQDVKFANAASLQTACLAALIAVAARRRFEASRAADRLFLAALALLVLFKPNTGLIAACLAAHYAWQRGPRRFAQATAVAAGVSLAAIALSSWYFHDARTWMDWYGYVSGAHGGTLLYPAADGNLSLVKMLSERGGGHGVAFYSVLAAAGFAVLGYAGATRMGREPARAGPVLRALIADPWLLASAGVLATFVVAPLVWPHYWVLLAIPILRFFAWDGRWDASTTCTAIALVALSRWPLQALLDVAPAAIYGFMMLSWMPLLVALGLQLARMPSASAVRQPPGDGVIADSRPRAS